MTLLWTGDAGRRWSRATAAATAMTSVTSISCPRATACFLAGAASSRTVMLRSSNGGATWTELATSPAIGPIVALACTSPKRCLAVGRAPSNGRGHSARALSLLATTTDAGASWSRPAVLPDLQLATTVTCTTIDACLVAGKHNSPAGGAVLRTTDGGRDWSPVLTTPFTPTEVTCPNASTCYATGAPATGRGPSGIWRSADGGRHWTRLPSTFSGKLARTGAKPGSTGTTTGTSASTASRTPLDLACSTGADCLLSAGGTTLLTTATGGRSWQDASLGDHATDGNSANVRNLACSPQAHHEICVISLVSLIPRRTGIVTTTGADVAAAGHSGGRLPTSAGTLPAGIPAAAIACATPKQCILGAVDTRYAASLDPTTDLPGASTDTGSSSTLTPLPATTLRRGTTTPVVDAISCSQRFCWTEVLRRTPAGAHTAADTTAHTSGTTAEIIGRGTAAGDRSVTIGYPPAAGGRGEAWCASARLCTVTVSPSPGAGPTAARLLLSSNGGRTWRNVDLASLFLASGPHPARTTAYAAEGACWSPSRCVVALSQTSRRTTVHLFETADGGSSWAALPAPLLKHESDITAVTCTPEGECSLEVRSPTTIYLGVSTGYGQPLHLVALQASRATLLGTLACNRSGCFIPARLDHAAGLLEWPFRDRSHPADDLVFDRFTATSGRPGQAGPGQAGSGQPGPGQTGPDQAAPGEVACPTRSTCYSLDTGPTPEGRPRPGPSTGTGTGPGPSPTTGDSQILEKIALHHGPA